MGTCLRDGLERHQPAEGHRCARALSFCSLWLWLFPSIAALGVLVNRVSAPWGATAGFAYRLSRVERPEEGGVGTRGQGEQGTPCVSQREVCAVGKYGQTREVGFRWNGQDADGSILMSRVDLEDAP